MNKKRVRYEFSGDEDDIYTKCKNCKYSYVRRLDSSELLCSSKHGCIFMSKTDSVKKNGEHEESKEVAKNETD